MAFLQLIVSQPDTLSRPKPRATGVFAASATLLSHTARDQASATAECAGAALVPTTATASQRFVQRIDDPRITNHIAGVPAASGDGGLGVHFTNGFTSHRLLSPWFS